MVRQLIFAICLSLCFCLASTSFAAPENIADTGDRDQSEAFAVDTTSFADGVNFAQLANEWQDIQCGTCDGADLQGSDGDVDYADLRVITDNYLQ